MSTGKRRVFSGKFKLSAIKRMLAGAALSIELQIPAGHSYKRCRHFRRRGADALRPACRPRKVFGVTYGIDLRENWIRAATLVDKILKGARSADLPVELPTKFQLVINLNAAKAIGLGVLPTLLALAD